MAKLLDFLYELLRHTIGPNAEQGAPFDGLRDWVTELLITKSSLGKGRGEGTIIDQILTQMDDIHVELDDLVRSPRTVGPEYELLTFRIGAQRAEQGKLAGILRLIAQGLAWQGPRDQGVEVVEEVRPDRFDGSECAVVSFLSFSACGKINYYVQVLHRRRTSIGHAGSCGDAIRSKSCFVEC